MTKAKKSRKGVSAITSGSIIFMIMLSVLTPLTFFVTDVNTLYDDVLKERKQLDDERTVENLNILTTSWHKGSNVTIDIQNDGPLATDITRIWVIPNNTDYPPQSFPQEMSLEPGASVTIIDESLTNYVSTLQNSSYYLKVISKKGNVFHANFVMPENVPKQYPYPLVILGSSVLDGDGNNWEITLHVYNRDETDLVVDWTIITSIHYDQGSKTRVQIIEDDLVYPPRQLWISNTISFSTSSNPNVLLVEFVGSTNCILGAYYFLTTDLLPPLPDLTLTSDNIWYNHPKWLNAEIQNTGESPTNDVLVEFYNGNPASGGILIGTDTINQISAGGSQTATIEWNPPSGTYFIYVIVDPEDTIDEFNEGNNQANTIIVE